MDWDMESIYCLGLELGIKSLALDLGPPTISTYSNSEYRYMGSYYTSDKSHYLIR